MHTKLKTLRHNADCLTKDLSKLCQEIHECEKAIIGSEVKHPEVGHWACPESPVDFCVYEDRNEDECIYCGQPEERK